MHSMHRHVETDKINSIERSCGISVIKACSVIIMACDFRCCLLLSKMPWNDDCRASSVRSLVMLSSTLSANKVPKEMYPSLIILNIAKLSPNYLRHGQHFSKPTRLSGGCPNFYCAWPTINRGLPPLNLVASRSL